MRLNHLNLAVPDVDEAVRFLTTHFGMREVGRRGAFLAVLLDDGFFALAVSRSAQDPQPSYPALFHLGFLQPSDAEVDALYRQLRDAGVQAERAPARVHGTYGFYFTALGGVMFEVSTVQG